MQTFNSQPHRTYASASQQRLHGLRGNSSAPWRAARPQTSRQQCVSVSASSVRARWCIDVQYGHKQMATSMLQEWVAEVGSRAGLNATNTRLSSGSVGVAESRLELEVTFASLSEWETFLAAIPAKEHRSWSQRVQSMIVGGSPRWELYRSVPVFAEGTEPPANQSVGAATGTSTATATPPTTTSLSTMLTLLGTASTSDNWLPVGADNARTAVQGGSGGSSSGTHSSGTGGGITFIDNPQDAEVVLDWKGEPMKVNPGDKLPFKFL